MKKILPLLALVLCLLLTACDTSVSDADATDTQGDTATQDIDTAAQDTSAVTEAVNLAPDFTVLDREGNRVSLSSLRGKPVVLNFWASWCGPCKREMPDFEDAYKKYGNDVQFLFINLADGQSETVEIATAYIDGQGYTFPIYFDTQSEAVTAYGISSIPTTFFINADGVLVTYATGAIGTDLIEKGIGMILDVD